MSLTATAVENKTVTYFAAFLIFVAGIAAYFNLGQLEDPDFTVKTATISTTYFGASPEEVELEVTNRIELALQEMKQIWFIKSKSGPGLSTIWVNIKPSYSSKDMPQIWDELRRKVRDVESSLPPGADRPLVFDDFGDVYGHLIAVTGDGFNYAELEAFAKDIKKELSLVKGVARVEMWGEQSKVIYLDASQAQLSALGISEETLQSTLQKQNLVVDAGRLNLDDQRLRIAPTGEFTSPEDIADLTIQPSTLDLIQNLERQRESSSELLRIRDFGTIIQGYQDPPVKLMRFNGERAILLAITNIPGVNIVDMGNAVGKRVDELIENLPVGLELHSVHWQAKVVAQAVNSFLISFAEALIIVIIVLTFGMGWRLSLIIGTALIATILASFMLMSIFGIDLQRMSLGALIIALGMMVDNAIVVADGFVIRLQQGMDRKKAAIECATVPSIPLLGATIVAVMAFYPIVASDQSAGEYCFTLFSVVAISLLVSWVISVTLTPVQCMDMLPDPDTADTGKDTYAGGLFKLFRKILERAIHLRWLTIGGAVAVLVVSVIAFGNVKQLFFPDSSMNKFMIDYWAPEGSRIEETANVVKVIEEKLMADERVEAVATFVGAGPPRFYLPVEPEQPNSSYAQLIVNVHDFREIDGLAAELDPWFAEHFPNAQIPTRKFGVGPSYSWKFEARFSGPSTASPDVLRSIANRADTILEDAPLTGMTRNDWRTRVQKVVPDYNQERGQRAAIWRDDIANATKRAFDGRTIGLYREADDLVPILLRNAEDERKNVGAIDVVQVHPKAATYTVPLSQVTNSVETEWEDPLIWRRDRRRTITAQANPILGETNPSLLKLVKGNIESIELPPGYTMEWGGEFEGSRDAQQSLIPGVIPAVIMMAFIVVALFNAFRPPLVIALTIPFVIIGISFGLLGTGAAFGFVALLGAMSLVGMMIKNAIVLLDQVNINLDEGQTPYDAVINAAIARLSPVVLAAGTTILGVIPLLQDVFWIGLAVTIMAGLTVGTMLTMIMVPVLYATLFKIPSPVKAA